MLLVACAVLTLVSTFFHPGYSGHVLHPDA
jgi:hypothetical protein